MGLEYSLSHPYLIGSSNLEIVGLFAQKSGKRTYQNDVSEDRDLQPNAGRVAQGI